MGDIDYKKLGFKAGIEIHQQLEGRKLFCNCPTLIKDKSTEPDFIIKRKLRASAGESGKVDIAAAHEQEQDKTFIYNCYKDCTCLLEIDEQPPNEVNPEALTVALQVATLLNAEIVDTVQFMRKTVVDGSNTSGFQRTAIIGRDGFIQTSKGKVRIAGVFLEEEAAQPIEKNKTYTKFNLSRLGIPLLEIATEADIIDPEHFKETAEKIGLVLRSVPGMKRGLGTIRQDVNVSIKGGARTEVKGFQDYKNIPKVIEHEINRQLKLLKQGKEIKEEVRNSMPDFSTEFLRPMPGASRMYPETDVPLIKLDKGNIETPELIEEKIEKYKKQGLGEDLAKKLAKSDKAQLFESIKLKNIKASFLAETLISYGPELTRKHKGTKPELITNDNLKEIFENLDKGTVAKDSIMDILISISKGEKLNLNNYKLMSEKDLEKELKEIIKKNKDAPFGAIMGQAMAKLKGKADGKLISQKLKELTK